ncbi:unnamed protein product [Rhizophagus irregularis]|nr:unnamed protein product [Rhizophagus irregularis]
MPEEFKQLEIEAVHHDPDFRPKITKMFEVLNNCFKKYSQVTSSSSGPNQAKTAETTPCKSFVQNEQTTLMHTLFQILNHLNI